MTSCQMICSPIITETVCGPLVNGRIDHFKGAFWKDNPSTVFVHSYPERKLHTFLVILGKCVSLNLCRSGIVLYRPNELLLKYQRQPAAVHRIKLICCCLFLFSYAPKVKWNRHKLGPLSNISNTRDSFSSGYPNTEKRVENVTRSGVFLTKLKLFG